MTRHTAVSRTVGTRTVARSTTTDRRTNPSRRAATRTPLDPPTVSHRCHLWVAACQVLRPAGLRLAGRRCARRPRVVRCPPAWGRAGRAVRVGQGVLVARWSWWPRWTWWTGGPGGPYRPGGPGDPDDDGPGGRPPGGPSWRNPRNPFGRGGPGSGTGGEAKKAAAALRSKKARRRNILIASFAVLIMLTGVGFVGGTYYVDSVKAPNELNFPQTTTVYYSDKTGAGEAGRGDPVRGEVR